MPAACILSSKGIAKHAMKTRLVLPAQMTWAKEAHGTLTTIQLPEELRVRGRLGDLSGPNWIDLHAWIAESPNESFAVITEYCFYPSFFDDSQASGKKDVIHGSGLILERTAGLLSKTWHFNFVDEASKNHVFMGGRRVNWTVW